MRWSLLPRLLVSGLRAQRILKVGAATALLMAPLFQFKRTARASTVHLQLPTILQQADVLYKEDKMREGLQLLEPHESMGEAEVLWRLARFCYKVGKFHSSEKKQSRKMAERAVKYAEDSVEADDGNFACHKWLGIVISHMTEFLGYKERIRKAFEIKDCFLKAIELNQKDATCKHLLGQWCYAIVDVPWYQRQFAIVFFATPPTSSFEEALSYFQAAEQIEPGFYSTNWLYLGQTHLKLGQKEEARRWLLLAAGIESTRGDDVESREKAAKLLKTL